MPTTSGTSSSAFPSPASAIATTSTENDKQRSGSAAPSPYQPFLPKTPVDDELLQSTSKPIPQLFLPSPFQEDPLDPSSIEDAPQDDDFEDLSKTPQNNNPLMAKLLTEQQQRAARERPLSQRAFEIVPDDDDDIEPTDDPAEPTDDPTTDATPGPPDMDEPLDDDEAEERKIEAADRVLCGDVRVNTVKDMQEAINVSHPFGLKIWKPALYKKDRSIDAATYSDLHSVPGGPQETFSTLYSPGNLLWAAVFGWWMCVAYLAVAVLVFLPVSCLGTVAGWAVAAAFRLAHPCAALETRFESCVFGPFARSAAEVERLWQYGRVLVNLSTYILWPFGKFIAKKRAQLTHYDPELPCNPDAPQQGSTTSANGNPNETTPLLPTQKGKAPTPYLDPVGTPLLRPPRTPLQRRLSTNEHQDLEGLSSDEEDDVDLPFPDSDTHPLLDPGAPSTAHATTIDVDPFSPDAAPAAPPQTSWQRRLRRIRAGGFSGLAFTVVFSVTLLPLHLLVTGCCFFAVVAVPMAKLNYVLLRHLLRHPLRLSAHHPDEHWRRVGGVGAPPPATGSAGSSAAGSRSRMASGFDDASDNEDYLAVQQRGPASGSSSGGRGSNAMIESVLMSPGTPVMGGGEGKGKGMARQTSMAGVGAGLGRPVSVFLDTGRADAAKKAREVAKNYSFQNQEYIIVLCTYNAIGLKYYKYTVDGVNIMFINLMAIVFFTLFDFYYLGPYLSYKGIGSYSLIFLCALLSVIPLSYFIGSAVSSITAQTGSLALGAVVNATFGSIVEVILYCLALMEGKSRMVEGAIVGSYMAGLLALPGVSMFFGGLRRKEQKFNSKAATVTSTLLIMSVIGVFGPTLFQEVYGTFELQCLECPSHVAEPGLQQAPIKLALSCRFCRYHQPEPTLDPIYQKYTRPLMYGSAVALVLVYAVGLWFTLRTHTKRIYNTKRKHKKEQTIRIVNLGDIAPAFGFRDDIGADATPRPTPGELSGLRRRHGNASTSRPTTPAASPRVHPQPRPADTTPRRDVHGLGINTEQPSRPGLAHPQDVAGLRARGLSIDIPHTAAAAAAVGRPVRQYSRQTDDLVSADSSSSSDSDSDLLSASDVGQPVVTGDEKRAALLGAAGAGRLQTTNSAVAAYRRGLEAALQATRGGAAAPVSPAERRKRAVSLQLPLKGGEVFEGGGVASEIHFAGPSAKEAAASGHGDGAGGGGHGGHDHPNWGSAKSTVVLFGATVLFSLIAEVLISSVDHVISTGAGGGGGGGEGQASGWAVDEKFLGLTLFAIVPTVTEFYNAIAFAQMGNIALSLEIGSAYTIQVALLQIPILVGFSAYWRIFGGAYPRHPKTTHLAAATPYAAPHPFGLLAKIAGPLMDWAVRGATNAAAMVAADPRSDVPPQQDAFSLVFPRWDLVAVLFSVFTVTYLYIEGKSNYFKGAMLLVAYFVLMLAFFFSPPGLSSDT
ncbi:hypothetical protein HDU96_000093 [Phlyctochytrium bullatum]|nr:hypothetical protein HDU96_000093 [Phlyctochytrium bullatum]